ncbi:MAG TPA: phosphoesterase [Terriglobales bacterium]|nr:phosphoesterase [Terriglobales bacterium]
MSRTLPVTGLCWLLLAAAAAPAQAPAPARPLHLPSNQLLFEPAPGAPQQLDSFPAALAASPDGRYVAALDAGFGTQSIAIADTATGELRDFADPRLSAKHRQTYFLGLAFSPSGREIFASLASLTDPRGRRTGDLGNGILVYRFAGGRITPERFLPIPLQPLAPGRRASGMGRSVPPGFAIPYPAGLAVFRTAGGLRILAANNLSDNALLLDAASGRILERFDLGISPTVPAAYPYAVVVAPDHRTAYCSLWNGSRVAQLDLASGRITRWLPLAPPRSRTAAGSHPSALLLSRDGRWLFVALSNADRVAAVPLAGQAAPAWLDTTLPDERYGGSTPNALAESPDGRRLFVADASLDAVAVFDTRGLAPGRTRRAAGFLPTEWYPTALAAGGGQLWIASGKGQGTGPNGTLPATPKGGRARLGHPYIAALLRGSLAHVSFAAATTDLAAQTAIVERANLMQGRLPALPFRAGHNPIRHVIYIIKENRTYDQVLGDLGAGDGDPSLTLYGAAITPNEHELARRFGVLDNFYDSGEVSGDGHVWSMAAITSDYNERTWQISYRNSQRSYDYEGAVAGEVPLEHGIADVDEPGTGYIWADVARHGLSHRNYGEYVVTEWCDERGQAAPPEAGAPPLPARHCPQTWVRPGQPLMGAAGQASPWPWRVPVIARDIASKPELVGHFDPAFADFRLDYPDQLRADEFLREFRGFVQARDTGQGPRLPNFIILRLPNDHTMGTRPGGPTPEASVADNDLAVGRVVEAVSHSPYWSDTAIVILEDDAQDGADHVDAHRSLCLVISKYSPSSEARPFVDHHFYTTVNAIRTMEVLLGLPPMNHNDARAAVMAPLFSGAGDQAPFDADFRNRDNGLIYRMNPARGPGARASAAMDWRHADANPAAALNAILWRERKGNTPEPAPRYTVPGLDAPPAGASR